MENNKKLSKYGEITPEPKRRKYHGKFFQISEKRIRDYIDNPGKINELSFFEKYQFYSAASKYKKMGKRIFTKEPEFLNLFYPFFFSMKSFIKLIDLEQKVYGDDK